MRPRAGEGAMEERLGLRRSNVSRAGSCSEERGRSWAMLFYIGRNRVKWRGCSIRSIGSESSSTTIAYFDKNLAKIVSIGIVEGV